MQVFKLYFKLLKSYKGVVILYFVIFMAVAVIMTKNLAADSNVSMKETKLDIMIVDEDKKTLGRALEEYFGSQHDLVEMEYDKEQITDALYWRKLDYVLVIPKGFEESILSDDIDDMELENMKAPGYYDAVFFESELSMYTAKLKGLLAAGYSMEEAEDQLVKLQEEKTEVKIASFVNEKQNDICTVFFAYVPYLFITLGMNGIGLILIVFNEQRVKDRMECSCTTMQERIAGLAGGILVFGIIMLSVVAAAAGILSKGSIFTDNRFPYFLINMVALLLFGLSLGFFAGTIAKNKDAMNGLVNVISLALCFLGGVFVPQEFFSETIIKVAKFLPTYWYVATNNSIGAMKELTPQLTREIVTQVGLVVGYALVVFAVTVVIISNKRKRVA
ncbi:MAG: ABC transporter permease [Clostridiales bacterium]|nr:ABC transporter permease [Clostridiales bacterium]